jgi:hypothetical protein
LKLDWLSDSRIAVVTLNRPDALNAMNTLMIQEVLNLFREQAMRSRAHSNQQDGSWIARRWQFGWQSSRPVAARIATPPPHTRSTSLLTTS